MLNLVQVTMDPQAHPHLLALIAKGLDAEQTILFAADRLTASPALAPDLQSDWQSYARLHARSGKSARFHLFSPEKEEKLVLVERLSSTDLLFLVYPAQIRIVCLEEQQGKLRQILNQPQPDALTQVVLNLNPADLKPAAHPAQSETQPISINP